MAMNLGNGLFGALQGMGGMGAAPSVPADEAMQPTIGAGMPLPAAQPAGLKMGLPQGGLIGIANGGQANGLMGLLQNLSKQGAAPSVMPQAGMLGAGSGPLPGMPGGPAGPSAADLGIPLNISPMNQF